MDNENQGYYTGDNNRRYYDQSIYELNLKNHTLQSDLNNFKEQNNKQYLEIKELLKIMTEKNESTDKKIDEINDNIMFSRGVIKATTVGIVAIFSLIGLLIKSYFK